MGVSTFIAALFFWIASLRPNRGCLVVAHDLDSAGELHEKQKFFYKTLDPDLRPMQKLSNRRLLHFANPDPSGPLGLESKIAVGTADNSNLGASFTIQAVHLSEFARYDKINPNIKDSMVSLNQAVPELPGTFVIKETTGQGEGYHKDKWDEDNEYEKIFLSFVADEEYRIEVDPDDYFVPSDDPNSQFGDEEDEGELIRQQVMVWYPEWKEDTPANRKHIFHEIMCRLAWRRHYIASKTENDKDKFRQEYPLTPEQAFAATGESVFDTMTLLSIQKSLKDSPYSFDRYGWSSHHDFEEIDLEGNKVWPTRAFVAGPGPLTVYEDPLPGQIYVVGADPCEGYDDSDRSAAVVLRLPQLIQVAVWHGVIEPDEFGDVCAALGYRYNTALLGVEVNSIGKATVLRLQKKHMYPRLYRREVFDSTNLGKKQKKYGWHTNDATRPIMITAMRGAIKHGQILLTHMESVRELKTFQKLKGASLSGQSKIGAPAGKKDDLVIANCIALQMSRVQWMPVKEEEKRPYKGTAQYYLDLLDQQNHLGQGRDYGNPGARWTLT